MNYLYPILLILTLLTLIGTANAADTNISAANNSNMDNQYYNMGNPVLTDIYVDPVKGNDINNGNSSKPLKTVNEALNRIPQTLNTGYRLNLMHGTYGVDNLPANGWIESLKGTYNCPIIIQSTNKSNQATLDTPDIINFYNCSYVYLMNLNFQSSANNVLHLEKCDHILIKNVKITGKGNIADYSAPQEDLKVNQCHNIYLEDSDISNAWNVPVDFVAVDGGHIIGNKIHKAGDWCIYLKGGSSHFFIGQNEIYDALNGGFSAGQGTGFEWMEPPYIHYETYDIKFVNNIIHDTNGAGMGVSGSYNILLAYNTLYRVGKNSHVLEFAHGIRSCDGNSIKCQNYLNLGGWGTSSPGNEERIPNKNIFVYNNLIYNPEGYQSQWSQFYVEGPVIPSPTSNIPSPSRADNNLVIKGNIIWNGPVDMPLGIEYSNLNENQLYSDNYINTIKPQLTDPLNGNFRPLNLFNAFGFQIPNFPGNDLPSQPLASSGNLTNSIIYDYDHSLRIGYAPGAFSSPGVDLPPTTYANLVSGTYNKIILLTLTMSKPGTIYYTLNGDTPSMSSNQYITPITISSTSTLKFMAVDESDKSSPVYIENYIIDKTAPKVLAVYPKNAYTKIPRSATIVITLNENVKSGALWSKIYIKTSSGRVIPATKWIIGNKLYIKTTKKMGSFTWYHIYLPANSLRDTAGNGCVYYHFKFKTGSK